jgi:hypothetical protein
MTIKQMSEVTRARGLALIGAAAVTAMACSANAAITIDNFDAPSSEEATVIDLQTGGDPYAINQHDDASILGGQRDVLIEVQGTSSLTSYAGTIGGGTFDFISDSPGSIATMQYDSVDTESGSSLSDAEALGGMDLTESGSSDRFRFEFLSADLGFDLSVTVQGGGNTASFVGSVASSETPFTYDIAFSSFAGDQSAIQNADSVTFDFNSAGQADRDFDLDQIGTAVPTPGSLATGLVAGGVALFAGRRRRA